MHNLKEKALEMLGVKIDEIFYLKYIYEKSHDTTFLFRITDNLHIESKYNSNQNYSEYNWESSNTELGDLLSGKYEIVKKPSGLEEGELYYYILLDFKNGKEIDKKIRNGFWSNSFLEKSLLTIGNIFSSEKEARDHIDEITAKYLEAYKKYND